MSRTHPVQSDTIYAQASGAGVAGVAVVRISGAEAGAALQVLTHKSLPEPRKAAMRVLTDPLHGDVLDHALVLWFPGPQSFTGEDVVELHVHGGRAVLHGIFQALSHISGLRMAEAGEFTRRAFDHGKMDLTQVEGLADLIHAETHAQRRQAQAQAGGVLGRLYDGWRDDLIRALAYLEAELDFSDEGDIPDSLIETSTQTVTVLRDAIAQHLKSAIQGERRRDGVKIAIIGPPNAGKSSLMNALAQREAAIVSEIAGTTRDVVEVHLDLNGYAVLVADTAGLRDTGDVIEQEGVRRAKAWAEQADIKIALFDGSVLPRVDGETRALLDGDTILLANKMDEVGAPCDNEAGLTLMPLSVKSGRGLDDLLRTLTLRVTEQCQTPDDAPAPTRERHRLALEDAEASLTRALHMLGAGDVELVAEDLRLATRALGRITGRVDVEDLLDVIFRDFCIGK